MFWKYIAIIFLILFFMKLVNPKLFPYIKKGFDTVINFIGYTFRLFFISSIYTLQLTLHKTIYVVGLDILIAFFMNVIITTVAYPNIGDFSTWFIIFKQNLIDVYVFSFFVFTYVIGLLTYINKKENTMTNLFSFFKYDGEIFKSDIFKNMKSINNNKAKDKGTYEYDEEKNEYKYYD